MYHQWGCIQVYFPVYISHKASYGHLLTVLSRDKVIVPSFIKLIISPDRRSENTLFALNNAVLSRIMLGILPGVTTVPLILTAPGFLYIQIVLHRAR